MRCRHALFLPMFLLLSCGADADSPQKADGGSLDTGDGLRDGDTDVDEPSFAQLREQWQAYLLPNDGDLDALPQDPLNPLTPAKVRLGRLLFHDPSLMEAPRSPMGRATASCATCHNAVSGFQAGVQQGLGEGGEGFGTERTPQDSYATEDIDAQAIRSPAALNAAWFENVLWNGQFGATGANLGTDYLWTEGTPKEVNHLGFHGLETQAIAGQDVHRLSIERAALATNPTYANLFADAFPDIPSDERVTQVSAGLAIAAYERTLLANRAPFQRWMRGEDAALSTRQLDGAILFFGRAGCSTCHNNPGLGSASFHALGMPDFDNSLLATTSESVEHLGRGGFTGESSELYAFKVPQLYNLSDSPFLGHGGTFRSVREVIDYKVVAIAQNDQVPQARLSPEFVPLELSFDEIDALADFVENALYDPFLDRFQPEPSDLPVEACVPNADQLSQEHLSCIAPIPLAPEQFGGMVLENREVASQRWSLPPLLIAPGGIVVVARNATQSEFEAVWGELPSWVVFVSANASVNGAPIINGGEEFFLVSSEGVEIDGPCNSSEGGVNQLVAPNLWQQVAVSAATPGVIPNSLGGLGIAVTEVADRVATGESRFEYVEIAYLP